jgi:hypothetical protein
VARLCTPTCMVASSPGGATRLLVMVPALQPQPNVTPAAAAAAAAGMRMTPYTEHACLQLVDTLRCRATYTHTSTLLDCLDTGSPHAGRCHQTPSQTCSVTISCSCAAHPYIHQQCIGADGLALGRSDPKLMSANTSALTMQQLHRQHCPRTASVWQLHAKQANHSSSSSSSSSEAM